MRISAKAGANIYELSIDREDGTYIVEIDGQRHHVDAQKLEGDFYTILTGGRSYEVSVEVGKNGYHVRHGAADQMVMLTDPGRRAREARHAADGPLEVVSAMPGKVVRLLVTEGDEVAKGQAIAVIEAMKMENEIAADKAGTIRSIAVRPGQSVEGGGKLMVIE